MVTEWFRSRILFILCTRRTNIVPEQLTLVALIHPSRHELDGLALLSPQIRKYTITQGLRFTRLLNMFRKDKFVGNRYR